MASDGGMEAGVIKEFIGYHGDEELKSYMNKKINKNLELEKRDGKEDVTFTAYPRRNAKSRGIATMTRKSFIRFDILVLIQELRKLSLKIHIV